MLVYTIIGIVILLFFCILAFKSGNVFLETSEPDYHDTVIKTTGGEIKIIRKHHIDLFLTNDYEFINNEITLTDDSLIGYLWLSVMSDDYTEDTVIDLEGYEIF